MKSSFKILLTLIIMIHISQTKKEISSYMKPANINSINKALMNSVFGETNIAITLQLPAQISNIIDINIHQSQKICSIKSFQPQHDKNQVYSVKLNQTIINKEWNSEIIASVYNTQNNNAYILLDNSTLIETKLTFSNQKTLWIKIDKLYSYQAIGSTVTWLTDKYQFFLHQNKLFVLENQQFSEVNLHNQGFWSKNKKIQQNIISVKHFGKNLYKLTDNQQIIYNGKKLIDFTVSDSTIYILDEQDGLISISITKQRQPYIYNLQQVSKTRIIDIFQNILFIIYQIQKRNYIAQYFISKQQITLNRYYYNYYSIKSLLLHQRYGIIDSYDEFVIFRHSINRNSFQDLSQVQNIYKSHGNRIVNIKLLEAKEDLQFIITFKDKIVRYKFNTSYSTYNQQKDSMNTLKVQCFSNKSAQYPISIVYKGICSNYNKYNPKQQYCTQTKVVLMQFQYNHRRKRNQSQFQHLLNILILSTMIIFSCLYIYKKIRICCKERDQIEQKYNMEIQKRSKYQAQVESTFNNDLK